MLGIRVSQEASEPLYIQLFEALRSCIEEGTLAPNERLPPTRTLADNLGVSRSVVIAAYEMLSATHLVWARVGSGTYVRPAGRWQEGLDVRPRKNPFAGLGDGLARGSSRGSNEAPPRWERPRRTEQPEWIVFGLDPELMERAAS